jgi:hypothetical protein
MVKWQMRFACWIPKATNTSSQYVILIAFPLPQWLQESASMLRYMYITLSVLLYMQKKQNLGGICNGIVGLRHNLVNYVERYFGCTDANNAMAA